MQSNISGVIIVSQKYWQDASNQAIWGKVFAQEFSRHTIFVIDNNLHKTRLEITKFLNKAKSQQVCLVFVDHLSPGDLASFINHARNDTNPIVLQKTNSTNIIRKFISKTLHRGHNLSPYSAIKLLPRSVCYNLKPSDISFRSDQSLIHLATLMGLSIGTISTNKKPKKGQYLHSLVTKVFNRYSPPRPFHILALNSENMLGAGLVHHGKTFVTHSTLKEHHSAANTFTLIQYLITTSLIISFVTGLIISPVQTMIVFTAILSTIYFVDVLFNLFLVGKSLNTPPELSFSDEELDKIKDKDLPIYTILVPLYKEANVLAGFVDSISKMDYPKEKLDVLLLLEADDLETINMAKSLGLPKNIRSIIVPISSPKTKPKACNYGLAFAKGEYCVIYDAEDHPDPRQLKKAILGFKASPPEVACLQAKLNYHNKDQNLLTRFFTAEYSLWFDVVLPGLQSINTYIPLGGTSNHFRTKDIISFEGWDAFNVTEDADLGSRLFKAGYRTAIIDSITLEEANSKVGNWIRQRSRWIKGYMQTYLVHNRNLPQFIKDKCWHALIFQLVVGGKIAFMLINPLLWIATISYFALYQYVGPTIESFYPTSVFYMAAFSLIFGNFLFMYYYMIGVAKHGHWSLVKSIFLIPIYWLMISMAAVKALYQLIVDPHYWEKNHPRFTPHF